MQEFQVDSHVHMQTPDKSGLENDWSTVSVETTLWLSASHLKVWFLKQTQLLFFIPTSCIYSHMEDENDFALCQRDKVNTLL